MMICLFEGKEYCINKLKTIFGNLKFYEEKKNKKGVVKIVGYYHSYEEKKLALIVPKIFIKKSNDPVLGEIQKLDYVEDLSIKHNPKDQYQWLRDRSIDIYRSLVEYNKRLQTKSIRPTGAIELKSNLGEDRHSYLDILLDIVNYYKKYNNYILFVYKEHITNTPSNPKWEKTIRKSLPFIINDKTPIYLNIVDKKKVINKEEELIIYFFSILNHLNNRHQLNLRISESLKLFRDKLFSDESFTNLCKNERGLRQLRKIKHQYFTDTLKRMYLLCELYFSNNDYSSNRKKEEFLYTENYEKIFEDMIDKLLIAEEDKCLQDLKKNNDGTEIDHLYEYKSLIDISRNIYYIGDSKYYRPCKLAKSESVPVKKQFTYAKNIIQRSIDDKLPIRCREENITEGYDIIPNFLIYGKIKDLKDFENHSITPIKRERIESSHWPDRLFDRDTLFVNEYSIKRERIVSSHWPDRLFDRDTLFVNEYSINFLFLLKSYILYEDSNHQLKLWREDVKKVIRDGFIDYFNDSKLCEFEFYECTLPSSEYGKYIKENFKDFNGKSFYFKTEKGDRLIIATKNDDSLVQVDGDSFKLKGSNLSVDKYKLI